MANFNGTLRLQKNSDADELLSLKTSGADLTDYREQLARERTARTLTLRRSQRPTIAQFLSKMPNPTMQQQQFLSASKFIDVNNFPFLDPSYAINQLNTGNTTTLTEFLTSITICAQQTPRLSQNLIKADGVPEAFVNALTAGFSEQMTIMIIKTLIVIFPIAGESQINYIDDGLCMALFELLSSTSVPLLEVSIFLTDVVAEASDYAKDTILCLGLHQFLIDIAKAETNENLTFRACEALNKVFSTKQSADMNFDLSSYVQPLTELLSLHSIQSVNTVLMCLVQITNKSPVILFELHRLRLFPVIVSMLSNIDLMGAALLLIGNMSVGDSNHIIELLNCGIYQILINMIDTEFTADAYWVLSNLVESAPHLTISLFNQEFIAKTVDISMSSSYDVMKESTFFLATLIIFTSQDDLVYFMNENVLDLMIDILGCGVFLIILRCLDALIKFAKAIENSAIDETFVAVLQGSDIYTRLNELAENGKRLIPERALFLLSQIDRISESILSM